MKVSARNTLAGTVTSISKGAVNAEVAISLKGGIPLVAVVTKHAVEDLGLKQGMQVYAIVKASSVMIGIDVHETKISARNVYCGVITKVSEGPVSTELEVEIGGSNIITAVVTSQSATRLQLKPGGHACAFFKASSVILGINGS